MTELGNYVLRVYLEDKFVGYVKTYRLHRNYKYRFEKTKNISNAWLTNNKIVCDQAKDKLTLFGDNLYNNFKFEITKVTEQELRKSKLYLLGVVKNYKEKKGIFKK